jgi:hypothetical protein
MSPVYFDRNIVSFFWETVHQLWLLMSVVHWDMEFRSQNPEFKITQAFCTKGNMSSEFNQVA